jgi:MFS family permease
MMRRFSVSNTVLLIICLMYLILYVDRVNISTAAPLIKADLALTNTQLGLAFSAFAYPYAAFQSIGGYFGDKFGPRLTLCVSSLIVCVATAATGVVGGLASLLPPGWRWASAKARHSRLRRAPCRCGFRSVSWGFAQGITHSSARIGPAIGPPWLPVNSS